MLLQCKALSFSPFNDLRFRIFDTHVQLKILAGFIVIAIDRKLQKIHMACKGPRRDKISFEKEDTWTTFSEHCCASKTATLWLKNTQINFF